MHVVSFEPDPRNVRALRRCVEVNGLGGSWQVVEAAAAEVESALADAKRRELAVKVGELARAAETLTPVYHTPESATGDEHIAQARARGPVVAAVVAQR